MTPTEKAVEAMARSAHACDLNTEAFYGAPKTITAKASAKKWEQNKPFYLEYGNAALTALISLYPGIASVIEGTGVVVEISTLREVERLSRSSCLVPPDGGEPTEQEAHISNVCGNLIREMADRAMKGGDA